MQGSHGKPEYVKKQEAQCDYIDLYYYQHQCTISWPIENQAS